MSKLSIRATSLVTFLLLALAPAMAQDRSIETLQNSDYFGFDLRTERDVTLDRCSAICLADTGCRAFTYNTRAKWCFLKSDFNTLQSFNGAVAGKVVDRLAEPDIGAPDELDFLPDGTADTAAADRTRLTTEATAPTAEIGYVQLASSATAALAINDPRGAVRDFSAAIAIVQGESKLWAQLSRAALAIPASASDSGTFRQTATSAAIAAYDLSRTTADRAAALAALAPALERGDFSRAALTAYEKSLELAASPTVQAEYMDLKARKGFRVVNNTVDADSPSPRVCLQLSESLVPTGIDYADFVQVDGKAAPAVTAKDSEICVDGLAHGGRYRVTLKQGLPAEIGEVLAAPVTIESYIRDRSPAIRFTGDSFVLPSTARRGIPLVSVNTERADMQLYRIGDRSLAQIMTGQQFLRQLDGYDLSRIGDELGEPVWKGTLDLVKDANKDVVTSFPVDEALPQRKPGVYVLAATPQGATQDEYESRSTQWFVVSDIGLSTYTATNGLTVFARSLGTAKPIGAVKLTLLARNNEVLGTATTDADGRAIFDAGLSRGTSGLAPAVMMAEAGSGGDFVFLDMTKAGFDLSDRGVTGRASPGPLDLFAWTERGIYRPGETVHAAALARDDTSSAVDNLPLTFIFTRPDGVEERRIVTDGAALGGHNADLALPTNAIQGAWTVAIHSDPKAAPIVSQTFLVEDFVPDRIEFDLTADAAEMASDDTGTLNVDGRFLYGAPAAGMTLEGEIAIAATRDWSKFPGYQFGLADEEGDATSQAELSDLPLTDEDGQAAIEFGLGDAPATTRLLKATATVRMREGGGRAVERRTEIAVLPDTDMIGIRPDFAGESLAENTNASFSIIAASPDGERIALDDVSWKLLKVDRSYQWYRRDGQWNYEPILSTEQIATGTVALTTDAEAKISAPVQWGRYRLEFETANGEEGPASSVEFEAGWYVEATTTETPDALDIALDKQSYTVGETARLKVSPRFAGELLVTVGTDRLVTTKTQTIGDTGGEVELPVTADWGPGAYITATLYRPGEAQESRMPMRAIGIKWLSVDPAARKLAVALELPEKVQPRQPLAIPVSVTGAAAGEEAYVTVAAVDVGILNLTKYEAPDPEAWYFGQRQLGVEMRDIYGRLIDGSLGAMGKLRTGGDGGALASSGSPPTERLVAFFSGIVRLGDDGKATVTFDMPQFNGTARIMAVAWTKTAVGHAVKDLIVRDPVVVTASLPRFMAPGDRANLRLEIANTDGPLGDYKIEVAPSDTVRPSISAPETVFLETGARKTVNIPLEAVKVGGGELTVALTNQSGLSLDQVLSVPVRPATAPVATRMEVSLAANGGSLRVDRELLGGSLLDGASVSVGVSRRSAFDIPSLLMTLDRYPYGCAEQTTSRALPLLYVSELSAAAGLPDDPDLKKRIADAITRVLAYQASSGSFGLWSPGSGDLWLDSYVTDFLTRAREQGFDVPDQALTNALDNLQNSLAYDADVKARGREIAYATYVLARNQKASAGDLRYFADQQIDEFDSPLARAQIAASLSLYGDPVRSERAFASAFRSAGSAVSTDWYRSDYGSKLRDGAAMLALAAESKPEPGSIPQMIDFVAQAKRASRYTSTQEEAWMLLAARAVSRGSAPISLEIDGAAQTGDFARRLSGEEIEAQPLTLVNRGAEPVEAVVTTVAAPAQPLPAGGDGFTIERTYYTMDGEPANVSEVEQNQRFVVVIKATEQNAWSSRLLISDLLPAGFEIDNPRIMDSAALTNFDWLGETTAVHAEFRDDRFVAAYTRDSSSPREITVAYVVRAVTPGIYAHPAASIEDMYRPHLSARTATGAMEVRAAQ